MGRFHGYQHTTPPPCNPVISKMAMIFCFLLSL
jgi:hypothetical protein